jgi:pimeloyl-ACP methyl ester carboxylesterase
VLVEIPDAGHLVNLARPKEFNAAVADFLDQLPPR